MIGTKLIIAPAFKSPQKVSNWDPANVNFIRKTFNISISIVFTKRKAKIKDTGAILPGHGGILDRLEGIFLGVPLGYLTLILLN